MPENRLPIKAYKMLYAFHSKNKNNWVSHVCFALYRYGFGFVWENQGVCDVSNFIREFRQRLVDCFLQEWHSGMVSRDRLTFLLLVQTKSFPCRLFVYHKESCSKNEFD